MGPWFFRPVSFGSAAVPLRRAVGLAIRDGVLSALLGGESLRIGNGDPF